MREIKFRAYLKNTKEMVEVTEINFYEKTISYIIDDYANVTQIWEDSEFEEVELMQYTGFKDKNDREIYVGDYIKYLGKTYQVVRNFTGAFVGKVEKFGEEALFICYIYSECEVIGNIYKKIGGKLS